MITTDDDDDDDETCITIAIYLAFLASRKCISPVATADISPLRRKDYFLVFVSIKLQERESEAERNDRGKRIDSLSKHQNFSSILKLLVLFFCFFVFFFFGIR